MIRKRKKKKSGTLDTSHIHISHSGDVSIDLEELVKSEKFRDHMNSLAKIEKDFKLE